MTEVTATIERVTDPVDWGRYAEAAAKLDAVIAEVIRLGRAHPTFIYHRPTGETACFYNAVRNDAMFGSVPEEITGCIIGTALRNLGYSIHDKWENHNADQVVCVVIKLPKSIVDAITDATSMMFSGQKWCAEQLNLQQRALFWRLIWLTGVQRRQDLGETWGDALSVEETPGYKYPWRPLELS